MLCYIFVIALALEPSFALGEGGAKKGNSTGCSHPDALNASDKFFTCFDIIVKNSIKHDNMSCATSLPQTVDEYVSVATKTACFNDTDGQERNASEFFDLLRFSLKNGAYKDFLDNGGMKCIKATKEKIIKCVASNAGRVNDADNKRVNLWRKTKLNIDKTTCQQTNNIKSCTLKELRKECCECKNSNDNLLYVSSLFDYMLERCTRLVPDWAVPKLHQKPLKERPVEKNENTTHILLAVLLTLALLGIVYVLYRDCCANTNRWKTFNEHMEMRRRRRSLVNNEATCQGN